MTWAVGKTVYAVIDGRSGKVNGMEVIITKIGRKLAYYKQYGHDVGFYLEGGEINGKQYSSPGKVWPSKEFYENYVSVNTAWNLVFRQMPYHAPNSMSLDMVRSIASMLEIEVPK